MVTFLHFRHSVPQDNKKPGFTVQPITNPTLMLRSSLFAFVLGIAAALHAQQTITDHERSITLHFAVNDPRLGPEANAQLDHFMDAFDASLPHEFIIEGHTDSDGGTSFNEVLAKARSNSVRERLLAKGVAARVISTRSFGERAPKANNLTNEDKQRNRRVEVRLLQRPLDGLSTLNALIANDHISTHHIDAGQENWLRGKQGSMVRLAANTLVRPSGELVQGVALVTITEALHLADMLAEGLSTRSGDRLLETGGMLRIEARDEQGQELVLATGANMLVSLPSSDVKPGMTLFTSATGSDWTNTGAMPWDPRTSELPKRPACSWPAYTMETYKCDLSGKPPLPTEPAKPREPQPPRRESYTSTVPWYRLLQKNRMAARDEQRYSAAMDVYQEKYAMYEEKMEQYRADCRTWPTRYANYKAAHAAWVADTTQQRADFYEKAVPRAEERYQQALESARTACEAKEAAWRPIYEARLAEIGREMDSLGTANTDLIGTYVFAASQLGWINCDRFYDVPAVQKFELIVHDTDTAQKQVYLVHRDINSVMRLNRDRNGTFVQTGIPRNSRATIVAYKVEGGCAWLSEQPVDARSRMELEFKPATVGEIRSAIQGTPKS